MAPRSGCWTCKHRKIGCDRGLPCCGNCIRTGRECQGYDIRLLWPDRHDGRRKDGQVLCHVPESAQGRAAADRDYGRHFLNVNFDDVVAAKGANEQLAVLVARPAMRPGRTLTLHPALQQHDAVFLSYYERVISPMVSTIHIKNGFRTELLPMALSRADPSASALCNAMLAVSAFHHHGSDAALPYKARAVRHLSDSLSAGPTPTAPDVLETQVAASMMLCVYSVFDETEGNWHMHLDGAKNMLQKLCANKSQPPESDFLFTWFLYHEVLGCFTQPFREMDHDFDILWLMQGAGSDISLIVGSLGCSAETLVLIHRINRLRAAAIRDDAYAVSSMLIQDRLELDAALQGLTQRLSDAEESHETPHRRSRILATAELYRLAALLYLQRVCPLQADDDFRATYLEQAFEVLCGLEVATSPWPLFIVACESVTDGRRMRVMRTLDRMDDVRKIGNVHVMRTIIETFWKQYDFRADAGPAEQMRWWDMINCDTAVPWFI